MKRIVLKITFFAMLGPLLFGGRAIWVALRNSHPFEVTVTELANRQEKHDWLMIKDCEFTPILAVGFKYQWEPAYKEVFIPVKVEWTNSASPVPLLIATRDPALLDVLQRANNATNLAGAFTALANGKGKMYEKRDVCGVVRSQFFVTDKEVKALREAFPALTDPS